MKNMFPRFLNKFENSCMKKTLTKFAGGIKLKVRWKVRDNDEITKGTIDQVLTQCQGY